MLPNFSLGCRPCIFSYLYISVHLSQRIPAALLFDVQRNQGPTSRRGSIQIGELWSDLQPKYTAAQTMPGQSAGDSTENTTLVSCGYLCAFVHIHVKAQTATGDVFNC